VRSWSLAFAVVGLASVAAVIAATVDGCALPSFTLVPPAPDAGHDAGRPEPAGCVIATYPDPPGGTDDGTAIPMVFAIHSIDMGDNGDTPGYDLDYFCTCIDDGGPSCAGASPQISTYCDAPGGVDNQAAKLFQLIELGFGPATFGSEFFSTEAGGGAWSLLIRLDGYNGMPDDPSVTVALFPSHGLGSVPKWDGTDVWPVMPASVGDGGTSTPLFTSDGAYVSQGVLVATLPTTQITLAGSGPDTITVQLSAGVLTGKLTAVNGLWSLKGGVLAARWPIKQIFASLSSYRDNDGNPICTDQSVVYGDAKSVICSDLDILVDGTQPKSAPCDALSIGLGFEADPALLGGVSDAGALTDGCSAATDPANDSCP
jgi:hypothetical protein